MTVWLSFGLAIAICVLSLGSCYRLARGLDRPLQWLLGGGVFTRLIYICSTRPLDQANDWGQHIGAVHIILEKHLLPQAVDCYECSHPPLYHLLLAPFIAVLGGSGNSQDWGLQWVTLVIFVVGMFAVVKALAQMIPQARIAFWAAALFIFWPRGFPFSITINNDVGAFAFGALMLCALLAAKPVQTAVSAGAAMLSKTSGAVFLPVALGYTLWKNRNQNLKRAIRPLAIGLFAVVALSTMYAAHNRALNVNNTVIGNFGGVGADLALGREFKNFVCFDFSSFVTYPDIGYTRDGRGRECFWNFFLKTTLMTEHDVPEPLHQKIGVLLAWLLIFLLVLIGRGMFMTWKNEQDAFVLCGLLLAFSVAGQMTVRWIMPMTATNDFRYVFLSLFAMSTFVAYGMTSWKWRAANVASQVVSAIFILLSVAYVLIPMRR